MTELLGIPVEVVHEGDPVLRGGYVYECYDAAGRLLYIGTTRRPTARFEEHQRRSFWFPQVHHAVFRTLSGRTSAYRRETELIAERRPLYNIPRSAAGFRGWETRRRQKPPVHVERGTYMSYNPALLPYVAERDGAR